MENFLAANLTWYATTYVVMAFLGYAARRFSIKINYTRKIFASLFFITFIALRNYFPYQFPYSSLASLLGLQCFFLTFLRPIRTRIPFIALCFYGIDRPEDRPHTLKCLMTEFAVAYVTILFCMAQYDLVADPNMIAISIFILAIGDGFAEPIGARFGKHTYRTRSLFSHREHVRSLEGSAWIFVSSVCVVWYFGHFFSPEELWYALLLVPMAAALAEAYSPHSWDGPLVHFACTATAIGIIQLV